MLAFEEPRDRRAACRPASSPRTRSNSAIGRGAPPPSGHGRERAEAGRARRGSCSRRETASSPEERDGQEVRVLDADRSRFRTLGARRVDLERLSLPGGAVDDAAAVGREPRGSDVAAAKRQPPVGRRGRLRGLPQEMAERDPERRAWQSRPAERDHERAARAQPVMPPERRRRAGRRPRSSPRSKARSCAEWKRCSGFFSRQWRTMRSRPGEMFWFVTERSGGSSFRIADIVSAAESPVERASCPRASRRGSRRRRRCPLRASAGLPRTCSGDM